MKTLFKSLKSKFVVNVAMIFVFGVSSVTGIFHVGGERHERNHDFRSQQISTANILPAQFINASEENMTGISEPDFRPEGKENDVHVYFGLFWLALMLFHVIQNWAWFKKIVIIKHILKNKLTYLITIVFILMALSGIFLWIDIIPRNVFNVKEIHEITGNLLFALIIIHIIQRVKWYVNVPKVMLKRKSLAN